MIQASIITKKLFPLSQAGRDTQKPKTLNNNLKKLPTTAVENKHY